MELHAKLGAFQQANIKLEAEKQDAIKKLEAEKQELTTKLALYEEVT